MASELTLSIQCEHGLNSDVDPSEPILLEHDLAHPQSIALRVHWRFGQQHLPPLGIHLQLLVECVVPQMLHVLPVLDDTVFHRMGNLEERTVFRGFVTDHEVFDLRGA